MNRRAFFAAVPAAVIGAKAALEAKPVAPVVPPPVLPIEGSLTSVTNAAPSVTVLTNDTGTATFYNGSSVTNIVLTDQWGNRVPYAGVAITATKPFP